MFNSRRATIVVVFLWLALSLYRTFMAFPHTDEFSSVLALSQRSTKEIAEYLSIPRLAVDLWNFISASSGKGFSAMLTRLANEEGQVSPLYFSLLYGWNKVLLALPGLFSARLLSMIFSLGSLWGLGLVVQELGRRFNRDLKLSWQACFAWLFLPALFIVGSEGRFYSFWLFLIIFSQFSFLKAERTGDIKFYGLWGAVNGLGLLVQPLHAALMAAQYMAAFIWKKKSESLAACLKRLILSAVVSALFFLPWFVSVLKNRDSAKNISHLFSANDHIFSSLVKALSRSLIDVGVSRFSSGIEYFLGLCLLFAALLLWILHFWRLYLKNSGLTKFLLFFVFAPTFFFIATDLFFGTSFCNMQRYLLPLSAMLGLSLSVAFLIENQGKILNSISLLAIAFSALAMARAPLWRTAPYGLENLGTAARLKSTGAKQMRVKIPTEFIPMIVQLSEIDTIRRVVGDDFGVRPLEP